MTTARLGGALAAAGILIIGSTVALRAETAEGGALRSGGTLSTSDYLSSSDFLSSADFLSTGEYAVQPVLGSTMPLFLSVTLNGREIGAIVEFTYHLDTGRMAASRDALGQAGLVVPRATRHEVFLDSLKGVDYRYDEATQSIAITAPDESVKPQIISAQKTADLPEPTGGFGAVVNYRLSFGLGNDITRTGPQVGLPTADIEARVNLPFGVFTTTGLASLLDKDGSQFGFARNESYFTLSNQARMLTATLGDFVSSTLPWGRAVRLGGVQLRRDFGLRSDVVANPRLSFSGIAAVPSTVDVYVGSVRAWSGKADAGPFQLVDLPTLGPEGEAVIVVKDDAGNAQESRIPFFTSHDGLREGMVQFSFDYGRPRLDFITAGKGYGEAAVGSASLRFGLTDRVTLQGQAEAAPGLRNIVLGANAVVFDAAEVGVSMGQSRYDGRDGRLAFGTFRTRLGTAELRLSSLRTSDGYADLATALGIAALGADAEADDLLRQHPARAQDAASLTFADLFGTAALNLGLIHSDRAGLSDTILSASFSQGIGERSRIRVGGFTDMSDGGFGLSLALNVRFGGDNWGGTSVGRDKDGGFTSSIGFGRPIGRNIGATGYRAAIRDLQSGNPRIDWSGAYRSRYGLAGLRLARDGAGRISGSGSAEGALVVAGGRVFATGTVKDSFAVVKLGLPGVPVYFNGQPAVKTGVFGAALVPGLRGNRGNRLSINPADLPTDATVAATAMTVVPKARSGVTVTFGEPPGRAALIVLRHADGTLLPVGTPVTLNGKDGDFVVGYDGQVWLDGLRRSNRIEAMTDKGTCSSRFDLAAALDGGALTRGIPCR